MYIIGKRRKQPDLAGAIVPIIVSVTPFVHETYEHAIVEARRLAAKPALHEYELLVFELVTGVVANEPAVVVVTENQYVRKTH